MSLIAAVLLLAGTSLQMTTSMKDFVAARRDAFEWWTTEDEIVDSESRWRPFKRWRARRLVRQLRTPEIHRDITHARDLLLGWILIVAAAIVGLVHAIR
jgi:hypothetical protein